MKRILIAAALLCLPFSAYGQSLTKLCVIGAASNSCIPVTTTDPLPVTTSSGVVSSDITKWGGVAVGAMANYGTSPGAVKAPGVNASVTNFGTGTAGSAAGGVVTVQGVASMTPVLTTSTPSSGSGAATAYAATTALASNKVLKASAGNLYSFQVAADSTLSGAAWWVMVYDATSLPGDGAVTPAKCYAMPAGTTSYSASFGATPVRLATGITIGVSTNGCFTQAASAHAFISGEAQ